MSQRRDLAETVANTAVGAAISVILTFVVLPLLGVPISAGAGTAAAALYFTANTAKTYGLRRLFRHIEQRSAA